MKFSLRFLIITLPCLLVLAFAVIWNVEGYLDHIATKHDNPWIGNSREIDGLMSYLHFVQGTDLAIKAKDLNSWFTGQNLHDSTVYKQLQYYDYSTCKLDIWERTYVAVDLDKYDVPTPDITKSVSLGVYSRGPDGISHSNGCDPDDIASWRLNTKYDPNQQRDYWRKRKFSALRKLVIGASGLLVIWLLGVVGYRMLFAKA